MLHQTGLKLAQKRWHASIRALLTLVSADSSSLTLRLGRGSSLHICLGNLAEEYHEGLSAGYFAYIVLHCSLPSCGNRLMCRVLHIDSLALLTALLVYRLRRRIWPASMPGSCSS